MILYSDNTTHNFEQENKWHECINYLLEIRSDAPKDVSLFLKIIVNTWYALAFDGIDFSLNKNECKHLTQVLSNSLNEFLNTSFFDDDNCQWLFSYLLDVRGDLFLASGLNYPEIEGLGKKLIVRANQSDNIFAQYEYALENCSKKVMRQKQRIVKEHISEYFDSTQKVDQYFIKVLTVDHYDLIKGRV